MTTEYQRLIRIGHELLAADRDVDALRSDCLRRKFSDRFTARACSARRRVLCQPIRDRLHADTLEPDDLALLRTMQEIASVRDEAVPLDQTHWSEIPGQLDAVVSALDHAIAADMAQRGEIAA
jgi:hypothetical protein